MVFTSAVVGEVKTQIQAGFSASVGYWRIYTEREERLRVAPRWLYFKQTARHNVLIGAADRQIVSPLNLSPLFLSSP